ncbi:restriction endonuclease subunit S [Cognaticolwellia beringensis]|uniref:Restriction endonuclease subunit S n=1 Tax=Cognaticolwellia beringensis TaxID=1967665 RepID=A0A222G4G0_9GAMM|nr:restriction endonuclease subunit S [Cognaticolwellia beringensis]ASP46681.1 restriction endonuclease subunit S [Cognaticolwellia beringensis]
MSQVWVTEELSQLGVIKTGNTPKTSVKENFGDFIPFIKPANFSKDGSLDYDQDGLSELGLKSSRLIDKNSILMVCIGATIGKTGFTNIDITCNQQINSFTPNDNLYPRFFYYAMLSQNFQRNVILKSGQATLPIINKSKWSQLKVSYPQDIEIQKQIVAKLDQAFADIEKAKSNAEQNLKNAKELFESYSQNVFSQCGEGRLEITVGEIGKVSMCKRILKQQTSTVGDIPFYKIGTFGKAANAYISNDVYQEFKQKYSFPKKGDILISASGTIGRRVIYDGKPGYFQDSNIVWIDNDEKLVLNEYLYQFYGVCDWNPSKGATISRLYNSDLRKIKLSFPNLDEQKNQVAQMVKLSNQTQSLQISYQKKLDLLNELKQSILQKAFNGELA